MARFKGLHEAINEAVAQALQANVPTGSPLAVQMGVNQPQNYSAIVPTGVFRWGLSVWGIDAISGATSYSSDSNIGSGD